MSKCSMCSNAALYYASGKKFCGIHKDAAVKRSALNIRTPPKPAPHVAIAFIIQRRKKKEN